MGTAEASDEGTSGVVLVEISDRIGTITINRPEARNALSSEVIRAIPAAMEALDADPDVDVMVLTGTDPAFSAGLDLRELGDGG
ncbi:MAG: enoyl-CoA hydratase-related protein, partial [Actinomycetota bacterium]|nr:enoyl-CoA hydratase-related protein [Actinomycetota bacterium]